MPKRKRVSSSSSDSEDEEDNRGRKTESRNKICAKRNNRKKCKISTLEGQFHGMMKKCGVGWAEDYVKKLILPVCFLLVGFVLFDWDGVTFTSGLLLLCKISQTNPIDFEVHEMIGFFILAYCFLGYMGIIYCIIVVYVSKRCLCKGGAIGWGKAMLGKKSAKKEKKPAARSLEDRVEAFRLMYWPDLHYVGEDHCTGQHKQIRGKWTKQVRTVKRYAARAWVWVKRGSLWVKTKLVRGRDVLAKHGSPWCKAKLAQGRDVLEKQKRAFKQGGSAKEVEGGAGSGRKRSSQGRTSQVHDSSSEETTSEGESHRKISQARRKSSQRRGSKVRKSTELDGETSTSEDEGGESKPRGSNTAEKLQGE